MGKLQDLWDEVEHAVAESLSNGEGRASAWYLQHHFNKAELGVHRLPDLPPEIERLQEAKRRALLVADERSKENVALRLENDRLREALDRSVNLQSNYALLLNMSDGGQRMRFDDGNSWLKRLADLDAGTD